MFAAPPERGPEITGLSLHYAPGENVTANCTAWPSVPKANLRWTINGEPVKYLSAFSVLVNFPVCRIDDPMTNSAILMKKKQRAPLIEREMKLLISCCPRDRDAMIFIRDRKSDVSLENTVQHPPLPPMSSGNIPNSLGLRLEAEPRHFDNNEQIKIKCFAEVGSHIYEAERRVMKAQLNNERLSAGDMHAAACSIRANILVQLLTAILALVLLTTAAVSRVSLSTTQGVWSREARMDVRARRKEENPEKRIPREVHSTALRRRRKKIFVKENETLTIQVGTATIISQYIKKYNFIKYLRLQFVIAFQVRHTKVYLSHFFDITKYRSIHLKYLFIISARRLVNGISKLPNAFETIENYRNALRLDEVYGLEPLLFISFPPIDHPSERGTSLESITNRDAGTYSWYAKMD
ncbi:hypothetical protein ALC57_17140 [Trachymyrmex cornetzi]|uniref:Ig-like domain-containing protein n=1 Tax=Trachymyrmex cornetzi TaxID=471704 RepID=A0A195DC97_9HYME|nr:hypothetical protein ALC57_17140 [Trachymyrmex cornetzi]